MTQSDRLSDATSSTADEESWKVQKLTKHLQNLQLELAKRDALLADMSKKLDSLQKKRGKADAGDEDEDVHDDDDDGKNISGATQAVKQKLRRFCRRRANGSLLVPDEVHKAWSTPGKSRDNLIRIFLKADCQKDPTPHAGPT